MSNTPSNHELLVQIVELLGGDTSTGTENSNLPAATWQSKAFFEGRIAKAFAHCENPTNNTRWFKLTANTDVIVLSADLVCLEGANTAKIYVEGTETAPFSLGEDVSVSSTNTTANHSSAYTIQAAVYEGGVFVPTNPNTPVMVGTVSSWGTTALQSTGMLQGLPAGEIYLEITGSGTCNFTMTFVELD